MDIAAISQALSSAVTLRDQAVVVQLAAGVLESEEHREAAAQSLALLRGLDLRLIVVLEGPHVAESSQLVAAIARHGQRALAVLSAGVVSAHKLMAPPAPVYLPVVDQTLLTQLCSLRYVPLLLPPVLDNTGEPAALSAAEVAAAIAKAQAARAVVLLHGPHAAPPPPAAADGPRVLVHSATARDALFAELLLGIAPSATAPPAPPAGETQIERHLPSGHALRLRTHPSGEEIELRSARGDLDLRVALTDAGPEVSLRCARLEIESPDVAFRCDRFDVQTTADLRLHSARDVTITADELHATTERDIHLNGAYVRLNCTPGLQVPVPMPALPGDPHGHGEPGPTG